MSTLIQRLALSGLSLGMLLACTPAAVPPSALSLEGLQFAQLSPVAQNLVKTAQNQHENITMLDVGHGQKTSAAFSVSLNFQEQEKLFKTLISTGGIPASTLANQIQVFLLEASGGPPGAGDINALIKFQNTLPKALVGGNQTFVFHNVAPNTSGTDKYYVGARVIYENASPAYILNLVKASTTTKFHGTATNPVVVTNTGGDSSGGVFVDPQYQIPAAQNSQLQMSITLDDAKGADIDSRISVTDGNATAPTTTVTSP
ncbi:MAG: hypothetical protein AB7I41_08215 [Candidatus Sericytochromatia bacterium]